MKITELVASILTMLALYMLALGDADGFVVGMFSNLIWIYWAHEKNAMSLMALNCVMILINLKGIGVI